MIAKIIGGGTMTKYFYYFFILLSICLFSPFSLNASDDKIDLSKGQRVYVPAYSHIYSGNKERPFLLTVTLKIGRASCRERV